METAEVYFPTRYNAGAAEARLRTAGFQCEIINVTEIFSGATYMRVGPIGDGDDDRLNALIDPFQGLVLDYVCSGASR